MTLPLVLDTCSLIDKDFRYWLRSYHDRKVLPSVVYLELSLYFRFKNKPQTYVDQLIRTLGASIEWFRKKEAQRTIEIALETGDFKKNARDYMIAAHADIPPWIVVTDDVDHFSFLGDRVKTPRQIMWG